MSLTNINYYFKYLKYKNKYLNLCEQLNNIDGGSLGSKISAIGEKIGVRKKPSITNENTINIESIPKEIATLYAINYSDDLKFSTIQYTKYVIKLNNKKCAVLSFSKCIQGVYYKTDQYIYIIFELEKYFLIYKFKNDNKPIPDDISSHALATQKSYLKDLKKIIEDNVQYSISFYTEKPNLFCYFESNTLKVYLYYEAKKNNNHIRRNIVQDADITDEEFSKWSTDKEKDPKAKMRDKYTVIPFFMDEKKTKINANIFFNDMIFQFIINKSDLKKNITKLEEIDALFA